MGSVRTMNRRRLERQKRLWTVRKIATFWHASAQESRERRVALQNRVNELEAMLADPEGTIQRGINERYVADMRQRELQHHAQWDEEVLVHKRAAARWMRSCVLELVTDLPLRGAIMALPLDPEL